MNQPVSVYSSLVASKGMLVIIFVFILAVAYYLRHIPRNGKLIEEVTINGSKIRVETADTMMKQTKGLSGRNALGQSEGMLFLYRKPGFYSFWMKDMNFPIDIIWIDENFLIVDITPDIKPDSFPGTFVSKQPSQYILEVNAGVAKNIARVGDAVIFIYAN